MITLQKPKKAMIFSFYQAFKIGMVTALSVINIITYIESAASQTGHHSSPSSTTTQDEPPSLNRSTARDNPILKTPPQGQDEIIEEIEHFEVPTHTPKEREVEQLVNQGLEKLNDKDYQGALADFDKVLVMNPEHETTYRLRGELLRQMKDYKAAVKDYTQAIKLNPSYWSNYVNRGEIYEIVGNYHQAMGDYSKAIELYPEDGVGYAHRGAVQARLGNYEVALKDFENAIRFNPDRAEAYFNRGNLYVKLGNIEKYRGYSQESVTQYEKAIADYQQAAKLFSDQGYVAQLQEAKELSQALKQRLVPTRAIKQ